MGEEAGGAKARRKNVLGWRPDRSEILKVQVRRTKAGWTKARRQQFLEELAMTCNVTRAAALVGMSLPGAYALRRRDAEFALLWERAIDAGSERLREMVLACALGQRPNGHNPDEVRLDPVEDGMPGQAAGGRGESGEENGGEIGGGSGGQDGSGRPFDVDLAMRVLSLDQRRARFAQKQDRPVTRGEMDKALMERLVKLGEVLARAPDAAERARADQALVEAAARRMMAAPGGDGA